MAVTVPAIPAPTLREIQELLQSAILSGDDAILATILDNSRTTRSTLFGVYRDGYASRLVHVLSNDYPLLRAYIGDSSLRRSGARLHRCTSIAYAERTLVRQ